MLGYLWATRRLSTLCGDTSVADVTSRLCRKGAVPERDSMSRKSSAEGTGWESPARQCREGKEKENESRRDDTHPTRLLRINARCHDPAVPSLEGLGKDLAQSTRHFRAGLSHPVPSAPERRKTAKRST